MFALRDAFNALIARDLRVKPEEVTPDFMKEWERTHPTKLEMESEYGGHVWEGLEVLTPAEEQAAMDEVDDLAAESRG